MGKVERCPNCGRTAADDLRDGPPTDCVDPCHRAVNRQTPPSMTHTYATLGLSKAAYDEIRDKLKAAGYDHAFIHDGTIDMHGIGVTCETNDVDQIALEAACAAVKAFTDYAGNFAKTKATIQIIVTDAIRKCQTI